MIQIGWLSFEQEKIEQEKNNKSELYNIRYLNIQELAENIAGLHAIVIKYSSQEHIRWVYESIMDIQASTKIPIWLIVPANLSFGRITNLHLGVLGNFEESTDLLEVIYTIKNTLGFFENAPLISTKNIKDKKSRKKQTRNLQFKNTSRTVIIDDDSELRLTKIEYMIFTKLFNEMNKVCTYEELTNVFCEKSSYKSKKYRLANHITHLRVKLKNIGVKDLTIKSVSTVGYRLE